MVFFVRGIGMGVVGIEVWEDDFVCSYKVDDLLGVLDIICGE